MYCKILPMYTLNSVQPMPQKIAFKGKTQAIEKAVEPVIKRNSIAKQLLGAGLKAAGLVSLLMLWCDALLLPFGASTIIAPAVKEAEYRVAKHKLEKRGISIPGEKGKNEMETLSLKIENIGYGIDPKDATIAKWNDVKAWETFEKNSEKPLVEQSRDILKKLQQF